MRRLLVLLFTLLIGCSNPSLIDGPAVSLNVNQATVAELEKLPGIGPKKARSIIASRNARGGAFHSFDEILAIDGIGETTLAEIRPYLVLGPPNPKHRR